VKNEKFFDQGQSDQRSSEKVKSDEEGNVETVAADYHHDTDSH